MSKLSSTPGYLEDGAGQPQEPSLVLGAELGLWDLLLCYSFPAGCGSQVRNMGMWLSSLFILSACVINIYY